MSVGSDNNNNDMSSVVGEGDITEELDSDDNLVDVVTRSDSEESYSGLDMDTKKILDKFNYYANVQEISYIWLKTLEINEATGTALLLAFLIGSAGCPCVFLNEKDYLYVTSLEKFEKAMRDATLSKRKFEMNRILEFIRHTFHKDILLRKFLMKEFVSFILLMSDSHFKSFRMVAVNAGTTVMSLLLKLEVELKPRFDELERKLRDVTSTVANVNDVSMYEVEKEKLCRITNHFNSLFDKLCHVCHRDVEVDIRLRVITVLIIWLKDYPQTFLNDNYLRYLVWMLTDPSGKVRFRAIKACIDLFKDKSNQSRLQMFVVKSKPLIMKMINDVSLVIAEAALLCLHYIYMNYNVLKNEEYEQIYCNVYSVKAKIAEAAGSFVLQKIAIGAQNEMAMLKDLARFHYESGVKGNEEYFVSALINKAPFLMNWKLWTKTILFTTNVSIQPVLCRMLISVIKLINNNEQYIQKKMKMTSLTSQEKYTILRKRFHADEFHELNLQKMTLHFAHMLPQLIQKFYFNEKCLIPLVQIPQYFDYNYNVDTKHIVDLLHQVFMASSNISKDTHCCFSIITILDNSQHSEAISRCRKFVHMISEVYFKTAVTAILDNKLDLRNGEQVQNIQLIIQKTVTLVTFHNLCSTPVWPLALEGLQAASNMKEPASDDLSCILKLLSSICYKNIYRRVDEMFDIVEDNGSVYDADMKKLNEYTSTYHDLLTSLLKKTSCTEVVETAFIAICHILLTFSKNNKKLKKLKRLVILPSTGCLELLSNVLETLVPCSDVNQSSIKLFRQQSFLKKYCYLLQSSTIRIEYLSNVLPYLMNEGFKKVVGETLCTLLRKNPVETSRVIINFLSYWYHTSQKEGRSADAVHLAEIIASIVSAQTQRKNEIAYIFRLHIAAFKFVRTFNCIDFLKVVVGFAKLLRRNMIPRLEQLIELFFGHTVPVGVHDYLDCVHQAVGISD